jgi:hypothetical protein
MSARDAWARMTPYEVGIPGREFADRNFSAISEEAEARGVDASDPGAFILLGQVGRVLKELQGDESPESPPPGEALHLFGDFLFHAYHFHRAGEILLLAETELVRSLVERDGGKGEWDGRPPAEAGYLQLPRHLVWSHPDPEGPPEDLDGIFWTTSSGDTLSLLAAMGVRVGRPGLSVVPLPPVPLSDALAWPAARVRDEGAGEDFETTLPGGELDRLYSVVTAGEILKLVARVFAYLQSVPESLGVLERRPEGADGGSSPQAPGPDPASQAADVSTSRADPAREASPEGEEPGSPREPPRTGPSVLPFRRIRLV